MPLNRREFVKGTIAALFFKALTNGSVAAALSRKVYKGFDLAGWRVVVGDAVCTAPGELPVGLADIRTLNYGNYSELRANVKKRKIMAHNITFKRITNANALRYVHTTQVKYKLPYLPSTANTTLNGQTIEGGIFIWDGPNTRLDYGAAWQWVLNPWDPKFGHLQTWTGTGWIDAGTLPIDTLWHTLRLKVDFPNGTAELTIDGNTFPINFTNTPKDPSWSTTVAARFQLEIVSLDVCSGNANGVLHKARFKNWSWVWQP
jgi:hypothetical protein